MSQRSKGRNGEGKDLSIHFNPDDPQEARALEMSRLLAGSKHGRRREAIIALLDGLYTVYEQTGAMMGGNEIYNAITAVIMTDEQPRPVQKSLAPATPSSSRVKETTNAKSDRDITNAMASSAAAFGFFDD